MAGRSRKRLPKTGASESNIKKSILEAVAILYERHGEEIKEVREESEQQIVNVAFGIKIDCSDAEPTVKTQIRFAAHVTDSVTARLDNPNQGKFTFLDPDAEGEHNGDSEEEGEKPKRGRGRPKKSKDDDTVTIKAGEQETAEA